MFKITNVTFPLVSHEFDKIKVCVFKNIYNINHLFICKSYVVARHNRQTRVWLDTWHSCSKIKYLTKKAYLYKYFDTRMAYSILLLSKGLLKHSAPSQLNWLN